MCNTVQYSTVLGRCSEISCSMVLLHSKHTALTASPRPLQWVEQPPTMQGLAARQAHVKPLYGGVLGWAACMFMGSPTFDPPADGPKADAHFLRQPVNAGVCDTTNSSVKPYICIVSNALTPCQLHPCYASQSQPAFNRCLK